MMKISSKYNNSRSIPISSIPKNEFEQAIKEFAEGDSHLENLLWGCFNNGIETTGSHSTESGEFSYIAMRVNKSHNEIKKMLNVIQKINGAEVLILPDGGNLFGGSEWYKPDFSIGFLSKNDNHSVNYFDILSNAITDKNMNPTNEAEVFEHMLDFHDFFANKGSDLNIRLKYIMDKYHFSIEPYKKSKNINYFDNLFGKAGLSKDEYSEGPRFKYGFVASSPKEFDEIISKCKDIIFSEWALEIPNEKTEGMDSNTKIWAMRRHFGDTNEGQEQFKNWIANLVKNNEYLKEYFDRAPYLHPKGYTSNLQKTGEDNKKALNKDDDRDYR